MISLFNNILTIALQSSLLISGIMLLRKIFSEKINIKVLTLLWILVLARLIIPFSFETSFNIGEIIPTFTPNQQISKTTASSESTETDTSVNSDEVIPTAETQPDTSTNTANNETIDPAPDNATATHFSQIRLIQVLSYIWLIGTILTLLKKAKTMHLFSKKIAESTLVENNKMLQMLKHNKQRIKLKRKVTLYECHYIDAPLTCGVLRPKILIPVGFISNLNDNQQNMILLHELYHIKNLDVLKNYIWLTAKIIYWFNPLINLAYKATIEDTELCCDTMVLNTYSSDQRRLYSQSLVEITKLSKGEMILPVALSFCEDKSTLRKRVEYMIKPTKKLMTLSIVTLLIAVMFAAVCFTSACVPKAEASPEIIDHISFEVQANEKVFLSVNADVAAPDTDEITAKSIAPANITKEHISILADYITGDSSVNLLEFKGIDGENNVSYTKFKAVSDANDSVSIELRQTSSGVGSELTYRRDASIYWTDFSIYEGQEIKDMEKSYDECLNTAEDLVDILNTNNSSFELVLSQNYTNGNKSSAYRFQFRRYFDDLEYRWRSPLLSKDSPMSSNYFMFEYIEIIVDDYGIVELNWVDPCEANTQEYNEFKLLDYATIKENFMDYCQNDFRWMPNKQFESTVSIDINRAELDYVLLYNESINTYVQTPVWCFIGKVVYDSPYTVDGHTITGLGTRIIVTINAIDSTIYE